MGLGALPSGAILGIFFSPFVLGLGFRISKKIFYVVYIAINDIIIKEGEKVWTLLLPLTSQSH